MKQKNWLKIITGLVNSRIQLGIIIWDLSGKYPPILNITRNDGCDVTWQPIWRDLNTHAWTDTLYGGYSVDSDTTMAELVYGVCHIHHNAPIFSSYLLKSFWQNNTWS